MPAGVATNLADRAGYVLSPVHGDNADLMHHLVVQDDVAGNLKDKNIIVIGTGIHRRTSIESHHASFGNAAVKMTTWRNPAQRRPGLCSVLTRGS